MNLSSLLQLSVRDITLTIKNYRNVYPFIQKYQLWKGLFDYGWVSKFLAIVGLIAGLKFMSIFHHWVKDESTSFFSMSSFFNLVGDTFNEGYNLFVVGGFKYVILILLEIVIFHFSRKTLQALTGKDQEANLKAFIEAQVRMIKVVVFCFAMELVVSIFVKIGFSFLSIKWLLPVALLMVQCFFLGFAIIDNYNEIYKMTIKQSFKFTQQYIGVALAIGVVVYVLMLLPLVGTVLAPLLGAVVATMTMHQLEGKDQSMDEIFLEV